MPSSDDRADRVRELTASILGDERTRHLSTAYLPDRTAVLEILERITWLMYPGFVGPRHVSAETIEAHVASCLGDLDGRLRLQIAAALRYEDDIEDGCDRFGERCAECDDRAEAVVAAFFARLPDVRRMLALDVQAAYDGDPAARHTDEVIFCYPGMRALTTHRIAHELNRLEVPLIPRIMSEDTHTRTGIDIHPGAHIGESFFIDHGTGVVIGETTTIGARCKIYQGVTLGAKSFPKDERGRLLRDVKRHPTLEDDVIVYAGATILGGDTVIGKGSVVNGGVFLTSSVPAGHIVRGPKVELRLRERPQLGARDPF